MKEHLSSAYTATCQISNGDSCVLLTTSALGQLHLEQPASSAVLLEEVAHSFPAAQSRKNNTKTVLFAMMFDQ